MAPPIPASTRAAAIKLRVERQLSAPEIARRVGICNATAYLVLRKYPWTGRRKNPRDWTVGEIDVLLTLWPEGTRAEIKRALPRRTFEAASKKANEMDLRRSTDAYRRFAGRARPVCAELERIRRRLRIKRPALAKRRKGLSVNNTLCWALGKREPSLRGVETWAEAMGYELAVRKKA